MTQRRTFLKAVPRVLAAGASGLALAAGPSAAVSTLPTGARLPQLEFVYECDATLLQALDFGKTFEGQRRIIPITGGTVRGPRIRGDLLNGGADWNLSRNDGAGTVEADYYLRTDDGILVRIVNKGVGGTPPTTDPVTGERFFMFTHPVFEAPLGKYDWLNRSQFIATLGARKDSTNSVLIRVFQVV